MSDRFLPSNFRADAKLVDLKTVYDGWMTITRGKLVYRRQDGTMSEAMREIHDHGTAITILPVDRMRRVAILARQLRVPLMVNGERDPMILEACAGLIDQGEGPEEAARRETEEELGIHVHDLIHIGSWYASPGTLTEKIDGYLANYSLDDRIHKGGGLAHEEEDIIVEEIALDELGEAVLQGKLRDAKTIILIQQLMLAEPELFF